MANTIAKNKTAKIPTKAGKEYSYTYTDLASINRWLDENGLDYYQEVETREDGSDYILTWRYINGEWEDKPKRGCKVVDATLLGVSNPAMANGSALSYARRYSLCLAFGLACEDDDGASLTKVDGVEVKELTKEEAENYTFKTGKHQGWTLKQVIEEDTGFLNWLLENSTDERLLAMIELLTKRKPRTDEEWDERLELTKEFQDVLVKSGYSLESILNHYKVNNTNELTDEQYKESIEIMRKKVNQ